MQRFQNYIGGETVGPISEQWLDSVDPYSNEVWCRIPASDARDADAAVAAAKAAFENGPWSKLTPTARGKLLRRLGDLIAANAERLAAIEVRDNGKLIAEMLGQLRYIPEWYYYYAGLADKIEGAVVPIDKPGYLTYTRYEPLGVVAAITPWNFPSAMITRKAGPALAAGCTMVCKPATQTPYSALALAELADRAGVPKGVFNVVTGSSTAIGGEMTSNPKVRKVTFTGSTEVGKKLMAQCAGTVKKLSLELGGNAPFIVFDDADLDAAVQGAIASKYRNTGQTCVCANRLLVHDGVYEEFSKKLAAAVGKLRVGDGLAGVTDQGPLIDAKAVAKVEEHIADALRNGASVALGGKRHALGGTFFEPTILTGMTSRMLIAREETFGPIAPLFKFHSEAEAIAMANDTEFGLAAYVYTRDLARSWRVSEAIEYGIVGLNTGIISTEVAPFGGVKESGTGREGSKYGILDYTELKYICVGGVS